MDAPVKTALPALSPSAIAALQQGNKIAAIKIVRADRNIGLKEAKDAVEQYLADQPALQSMLEADQSKSRKTFLLWLAASAALALILVRWLLAR
jgi:ribosomal protein L7/L12